MRWPPSSRLDGWLLLALGIVAAFIPIGYLSGDAIHLADTAMATKPALNPNHLLLEPVATAWLALMRPVFPGMLPADLLGCLSLILGALSAALFRLGVAPFLTGSRFHANVSSAAFLGASAFDRLWISGEIHMIQMVPLVGMFAAILAWLERGRWQAMAIAAGCGALAVLAFVSNVLVVGAVAVALLLVVRHQVSRLRGALLFPVLAALGFLGVAGVLWFQQGGPAGTPWDWLLTYRGNPATAHAASAYGVRPTLTGIVEAAARATFGLASALTDLSPLTGYLRQGYDFTAAVVVHPVTAVIAWALLAFGCWRLWLQATEGARFAAASAAGVALVLFAFGLAWDNSDDQFYFQLTPWWAAAVLSALDSRRRAVYLALALVLGVNLWDLVVSYMLPDRNAALADLRREATEGLVVVTGTDQPSNLIVAYKVVPEPGRLLSLRAAIDSFPGDTAITRIRERVRATLATGAPVTTIGVLGADRRRFPWPGLERRGLSQEGVEAALGSLGRLERRGSVFGGPIMRISR